MSGHGFGGARVALGGTAVVCCVHDRQKRVITDAAHVRWAGVVAGQTFNPRKHKLQLCACCQNIFVTLDDTPRLCEPCTAVPTHPLGGPLSEPTGVIE